MPANFNELKQHCKEERAKIPPQHNERQIKPRRAQFLQGIAAKDGLQATQSWGVFSF